MHRVSCFCYTRMSCGHQQEHTHCMHTTSCFCCPSGKDQARGGGSQGGGAGRTAGALCCLKHCPWGRPSCRPLPPQPGCTRHHPPRQLDRPQQSISSHYHHGHQGLASQAHTRRCQAHGQQPRQTGYQGRPLCLLKSLHVGCHA